MRCPECDFPRLEAGVASAAGGRGTASRLGRLSLLYCERCGLPLSPPNVTETLLAKLTQLARFGLSAGDRPLLSDDRPPPHAVPAEAE